MTETQTQKIRFGHSPDPDDAFMFYAFEKKTIPMNGFEVDHVIKDIESLNQRALSGEDLLEVTAVSCHAYAHLADKYAVMRSGASIGDKYGPILVARDSVIASEAKNVSSSGLTRGSNLRHADSELDSPIKSGNDNNKVAASQVGQAPRNDDKIDLKGKRIAIPGKLTTAYLAMQIFEKDFEAVFIDFDEILNVVERGEVDYGLVIHEGQLTYATQGLTKVLDLGEWWDETYGVPLPLGVDVIRKDLGAETMTNFAKLFRASIEHSLANRKPALDYAIQYGRGLDDKLNDQFVGMYVNDLTVDLGPRGEAGFRKLLDEGYAKGIIPHKVEIEFVG